VTPRQRYTDQLAEFDRDGRAADLHPEPAPLVPAIRAWPLNVGDEREGVDGRWELHWPNPAADLGNDLRHVMHITPAARLGGNPYYICSQCRDGLELRQYAGDEVCRDVRGVLAYLALQPQPAA
jgi:hypothetical protein